jgi:VWFA-related protein
MTRARLLANCCAVVLLLGAPPVTRKLTQERTQGTAPGGQIRVTTNEVTVPVTVTDKSGEFVLDLEQKNFQIFDGGVPQTIDHCELGGDPLAVALVIETSSRLHAMVPAIHSLSSIFTDTVMALDGEAAVVTYDSTANVVQPFTTDHEAVGKAIADTQFGKPEVSLYDGMAKGVRLLQTQPTNWRRIMLVIGESQDDDGEANLGRVVRDAERANISIYVVGASSVAADLRGDNKGITPLKLPGLPRITGGGPCVQHLPGGVDYPCLDLATPALWLLERGTNEIKRHQLEIAAAATGGADYRASRDSALRNALDRIGGELHAQYVLTYRPNSDRTIGFHRIEVRVSRPDLTVRARPGYYFGVAHN